MSRCLTIGLLLLLLGCQTEVEYQARVDDRSGHLVISRADFDEGTCMTLVLTGSELDSGEQPTTGIELVHRHRTWSVVPMGGWPVDYGPYIYAREVSLEPEECSPTELEGEPLGTEGSGKMRFDQAVGSEQDGWYYSRVRINVEIDGVRFRETIDIDVPDPVY